MLCAGRGPQGAFDVIEDTTAPSTVERAKRSNFDIFVSYYSFLAALTCAPWMLTLLSSVVVVCWEVRDEWSYSVIQIYEQRLN